MNSEKTIQLKVRENHTFDNLTKKLSNFGYERSHILSIPGEYIVLGGSISIFPVNFLMPTRIEFFGNQIERIIIFDLKTGKTEKTIENIEICPNYFVLEDGSKIKVGDYVVHEDHGIGYFSNIQTREVSGKEELYIVIKYLKEDVLFVPYKLKEKLSRYIGVGRRKPKLSRLGSKVWTKTYKKTYENVILLARELLKLYAKREVTKRDQWKFNSEWNREVLKSFKFKETKDQLRAVEDVFKDIEKDIPMDRLICGDVGFGKTEVAIRAAAQAMANGYQVAMLVPTTVLVEQHYINLKKRFENLPIRIDHLSRFIDLKSQEKIVEEIKVGKIDLIVGTHRLFGGDIKFKNLGLLIIDEEQKFGVKDKEKLKQLKTNLNVLSLTATPIPRTLFMALSGIRNISQISSPPLGRREIDTKIAAYNDELVKEYIEREIKRGGQVYYLHNEVRTIGAKKIKLSKAFPNLNIEVAHGQLREEYLAQTMSRFAEGKIDILVCSTIIENGLDLSNANTLIVEDADKFGLSQLYQIRGRIGRSKKQAYSLFLHKDKKITENAFKRLKALVENTELGTGYNIALSDLEIRGGGNILGKEQHGNMEAVGLVLYSKLLEKAVKKIR